jgi:hypothetical protein
MRPPRHRHRKTNAQRDALICARWESGEGMSQLAAAFGVSRQRIEQIVKYHGYDQARAKQRGIA